MGFASVLIISITVRLSVRIQVDISVRQDSRHRRLRQCPLFVGLKALVEESLIKQAVSVYNKLFAQLYAISFLLSTIVKLMYMHYSDRYYLGQTVLELLYISYPIFLSSFLKLLSLVYKSLSESSKPTLLI